MSYKQLNPLSPDKPERVAIVLPNQTEFFIASHAMP